MNQKIKMVIWDLDDTLWDGTISEGDVFLSRENRQLIVELSKRGIINSICSKNDFQIVQSKLEEEGIFEYFVFNSIDWTAKGQRVAEIIKRAKLRAENILFIDDSEMNLAESKYYSPNLTTASPEKGIQQLKKLVVETKITDPDLRRLNQYKRLELRDREAAQYESNEDFLLSSNIQVTISYDCLKQIDRIHELILRTNQLNYTKIRSTKIELQDLLQQESVNCGYIKVKDNYGDYGIVGFYAQRGNELVHFLFSCRILGMGVEQYVYWKLDCPQVSVSGEVSSDLECKDSLKWINQHKEIDEKSAFALEKRSSGKILLKGPCDLFQIFPYIRPIDRFDTEFTHVNESGIVIESTGHTTNILQALKLTTAQVIRLIKEVPFTDESLYSKSLLDPKYRIVVLSILADCNLGVYERIRTGEKVAFLEYINPITESSNWDNLIKQEYPTCNFQFTRDYLTFFRENYRFVGRNSPEIIVSNLKEIRELLPSTTTLVIMLGGELEFKKNQLAAYNGRNLYHKQVNDRIRNWATKDSSVKLLDVNKYLTKQGDFDNHYNHYVKKIYYCLSRDLISIINESLESDAHLTLPFKMVLIKIKELLAPIYYKARKVIKNE